MGSGEGDALKTVTVTNNNSGSVTSPNFNYFRTTPLTTTDSFSYSYYNTVYVDRYQIRCPVKTCKTMNWLVVDKITPCTKCKTKLKAVLEQADFEVPVTK